MKILEVLHRNILEKIFFDLHLKFEELCNNSQLTIALIVERLLKLDERPLHTFEDYINFNKLGKEKNIYKDKKAIELIVSSFSNLLTIERIILNKAGKIDDEETNSMTSNFIAEQEKTIWMLIAWQQE